MDFTHINPATVLQAAVRARVEHPERYQVKQPKRTPKVAAPAAPHHHVSDGDGDWDVVACSGKDCVCTYLHGVEECRKTSCRLEYSYERQERITRELMAEGMSEQQARAVTSPW